MVDNTARILHMNHQLPIVGIAGRYCAGKDLACSTLLSTGFRQLEISSIRFAAIRESREELIREFGPVLFFDDGSVNTDALSSLMLSSTQARMQLEGMLYPKIIRIIENEIDQYRRNTRADRGVVINDKMLFYLNLANFCKYIVYVKAPWWMRISRAWKRDSAKPHEMIQRIYSSRFMVPRLNGEESDPEIFSIYNVAGIENFQRQIEELAVSLV